MTETHSLGEWEKEWLKFCSTGDGRKLPIHLAVRFKALIESMLLAQKEGFRREIEELRRLGYDGKWAANSYQSVYNQALDDLLTKLDTNLI